MRQRRPRQRPEPPDRGALEERLGHRFQSPQLLDEALTHGSVLGSPGAGGRTYERLEFLGDRVLGLIVAHLLLERFPEDAEGALTHRLVALVRRESLAAVAKGLDLGRWLRTSASEAGTVQPAILADCCEAVIGAIYLDGGFAAAQGFVARHWNPLIETVRVPPRDAKMALQEWAHARALAPPLYRVVGTAGPAHATTFTVEVSLAGRPVQTASAGTKRSAERAAAALMLERIQADDRARG